MGPKNNSDMNQPGAVARIIDGTFWLTLIVTVFVIGYLNLINGFLNFGIGMGVAGEVSAFFATVILILSIIAIVLLLSALITWLKFSISASLAFIGCILSALVIPANILGIIYYNVKGGGQVKFDWYVLIPLAFMVLFLTPLFRIKLPEGSLLSRLGGAFRKNMRDYGMYIAFVVVIIVFFSFTGGTFLSPRNISNLINQEAYIVVMSVAMTLVLIIRQIELSIGFFAGFMGAVAIVGMKLWGLPVYIALPLVLVVGALFGLFNGFLVSKIGVPAFVVTLGGQFLFKGLLGWFLNSQAGGTVFTDDPFYIGIGQGFVPGITKILGMHLTPIILGALCIVMFIYFQLRARRNLMKYGFEVSSLLGFVLKLTLISAIIAYLIGLLASYNGFSWTAIILAVVVFIYNFIMSKTTFGRHVYAVGGNPEAAELSGINVKRLTVIVFMSMSVMSAVAGIMISSSLRSATPQLGQGKELYAIAGAFVGGTSPAGGIGKVTGSVIGAYLMSALGNGMRLMGARTEVQDIVIAIVLVVAVIFDITTRKTKAKTTATAEA